jgi:hypothetical protein
MANIHTIISKRNLNIVSNQDGKEQYMHTYLALVVHQTDSSHVQHKTQLLLDECGVEYREVVREGWIAHAAIRVEQVGEPHSLGQGGVTVQQARGIDAVDHLPSSHHHIIT